MVAHSLSLMKQMVVGIGIVLLLAALILVPLRIHPSSPGPVLPTSPHPIAEPLARPADPPAPRPARLSSAPVLVPAPAPLRGGQ